MDRGIHLVVAAAFIVVDVILYVIVARAATGKVGPQAWVGIRTRATRKSEASWLAAHVTAYPIIRDTALANAGLVILSLFLPISFQLPVIQIALGVLLVGVILAAFFGNKAAREVN